MNKENILKVADEIEKIPDKFDMQYPSSCVAGFAGMIFGVASTHPATNGAIHLGLRYNQMNELFLAHSMGPDGITQITEAKSLVPSALRWMVLNNDINWRRAFTAVMMDNAIGKDKT